MTQIDTSTEAVEAMIRGGLTDIYRAAKLPITQDEANTAKQAADMLRALRAEVESIKAQPVAVTVGALVWEHHPSGLIASTGMGSAYLIDTRNPQWLHWLKWPGGPGPERNSLEEMKAAAQADYEVRKLSDITARTEDEVWNEAIEAAATAVNEAGYYCVPSHDDATNLDCQIDHSGAAIRAIARPTKGETK